MVTNRRILSSFRHIVNPASIRSAVNQLWGNRTDFFISVCIYLDGQIFGILIFPFGFTPNICVQIFKSSALLEVP